MGSITKSFLETEGNYPSKLFHVACALRQSWPRSIANTPGKPERPRILLPLSSSASELIGAVSFFRTLAETGWSFDLGIRCHPEFPLTLLPKRLLDWAKAHTSNLSGTPLSDNLAWCNLTAYVSSTVALESLIHRKPIVYLSIGDPLVADPVLGEAPFRWGARNAEQFVQAVTDILGLPSSEYESRANAANAYVADYLRPVSRECVDEFYRHLTGAS
jgi:hypothetical protein